MGTLRSTAASVVAASAVLLTGQPGVAAADTAITSQGPQQGFRAAADIAADIYREKRRAILGRYREASRAAQETLGTDMLQVGTAAQRRTAWEEYKAATQTSREQAQDQMRRARQEFRTTVAQARRQFGVESTITAASGLVDGPLWSQREAAGA